MRLDVIEGILGLLFLSCRAQGDCMLEMSTVHGRVSACCACFYCSSCLQCEYYIPPYGQGFDLCKLWPCLLNNLNPSLEVVVTLGALNLLLILRASYALDPHHVTQSSIYLLDQHVCF
jgi:hypothetical protein